MKRSQREEDTESSAASKRPSENSGPSPRTLRRASRRSSGEDVSRTDAYGRSPLHHASWRGDLERMRRLLERGADTRLPDRRCGWTPLHFALIYRKEAAAELLVAADGGNEVQDQGGHTALHLAAETGYVEIIRKLLAGGSSTRVQDGCRMTPLHHALHYQKEVAAELLAEADGRIDSPDKSGSTPLHLAAGEGYESIIGKLLAGGSRTRARDDRGMTPLHRALWRDKEAAAVLLADADSGNDVKDEHGRTPLHCAAEKAFEGVVGKLLQSGANPHVRDASGEYPIRLALGGRRNENIPKMILSVCVLKGIAIDWEELRLGANDRQFCAEALSRCGAEIRLMKDTPVPASSVSHHHLVTRHVCWVAPRLRIGGDPRSDLARRKFPIYAELIVSKLQLAEERRVRMDRCLECFSHLSPAPPPTCTDVVLLCLSEDDLENFVRAFQFDS